MIMEKEGHNLPDKVDRKEQELFVRLQKRQRKKNFNTLRIILENLKFQYLLQSTLRVP